MKTAQNCIVDNKHVIVTSTGSNIKKYKNVDIDNVDKFGKLFAQMNANFSEEYKLDEGRSLCVKQLEIKTASNISAAGFSKYTKGLPVEDKANPENDKVRWYKIDFNDGTSTGWRCWLNYDSVCEAVQDMGEILRALAGDPGCRDDAWEARRRWIKDQKDLKVKS